MDRIQFHYSIDKPISNDSIPIVTRYDYEFTLLYNIINNHEKTKIKCDILPDNNIIFYIKSDTDEISNIINNVVTRNYKIRVYRTDFIIKLEQIDPTNITVLFLRDTP